MNTLDTVLLIILTTLLSLFTIIGIFVLVAFIKLISAVRRTVEKAEDIMDTVDESAAEIFANVEGRMALFKLVRNIIKLVKKHRR
jgi:uncharacterized protein (UPF0335 family)